MWNINYCLVFNNTYLEITELFVKLFKLFYDIINNVYSAEEDSSGNFD